MTFGRRLCCVLLTSQVQYSLASDVIACSVYSVPPNFCVPVRTVAMGSDASELIVPFLGALQASVAVLLTIFTGVLASQFQLIGEKSSKEISKVCVRLFLPALLIVNVGSQLHFETVGVVCSLANSILTSCRVFDMCRSSSGAWSTSCSPWSLD